MRYVPTYLPTYIHIYNIVVVVVCVCVCFPKGWYSFWPIIYIQKAFVGLNYLQ